VFSSTAQTEVYATITENLVTATKKVVGLARFKTPFFPSPTFKGDSSLVHHIRVNDFQAEIGKAI
jgi:hypothetical protein